MKFIAHRGLFNGPDANLENRTEQIVTALSLGYDCEIDLWVVDSKFFLGHDRPDFEIKENFLNQQGLWIHAKNLSALRYLSETGLAYFWHQSDDCVITSNGYIWTFPDKELTDRSIQLMPEWKDPAFERVEFKSYGICSDYVEILKSLYDQRPKSEV